MTDKEIWELADKHLNILEHGLLDFARAIEKAAREDCAVVCEKLTGAYITLMDQRYGFNAAKEDCATAIRNQGERND